MLKETMGAAVSILFQEGGAANLHGVLLFQIL
jgi:hypothetical protein